MFSKKQLICALAVTVYQTSIFLPGSDERQRRVGPDGGGPAESPVPAVVVGFSPGCEGRSPDAGQHLSACFRKVPPSDSRGDAEGKHGRSQQPRGFSSVPTSSCNAADDFCCSLCSSASFLLIFIFVIHNIRKNVYHLSSSYQFTAQVGGEPRNYTQVRIALHQHSFTEVKPQIREKNI